MSKISRICLIILFSLAFLNSYSETVKIRVISYPPQYYKDAQGNWTGIDVELASALVKKAGYTPEFVELPWSRALKDIESGELEMMMNLSKTDERSVFLEWIGPERDAKMVIITRKEDRKMSINSLDDLVRIAKNRELSFGIQKDAFYSKEFNDRLADEKFAPYFETVSLSELNPKKLSASRIVGYFDEYLAAAHMIRTNPDYKDFVINAYILSLVPVYFGVSKQMDKTKLQKLINAYYVLEKNGTLKKIREKYHKY